MTISITRGTELTINELILTAYQLIGIMPTAHGTDDPNWTADSMFAKRLLDTIIDELQTEGNAVRSVVMYNLPLVIGTYTYSMPATCLDVIGDGAYIAASQTDLTKATGETVVEAMDRAQWQRISSKSSTGRTSRYWANAETSPLEVRLWPIPDEAGHVRLQLVQLYADTLDGAATVELQQYWIQYLIWELGAQLAVPKGLPINRCGLLASKAKQLRDRAKAYSAQHVDTQMSASHPTPWSN
jgi:hypothetical protein